MADRAKKVVYLLGAGATHSELLNLYPLKNNDGLFLKESGLLMKHVSERVITRSRVGNILTPQIKKLLSPTGLSNIELFIGLVEKNQIKSEGVVANLKKEIQKDIEGILTLSRRDKFVLHRALLEFHSLITQKEELLGIISLNYDEVLEDAFKSNKTKPNYADSSTQIPNTTPLLKLHGGFKRTYRGRNLPILTPGINKNYLQLPYNFIWGKALELLIECSELRVIGSSLSQNDIGLIDLLIKAHLVKESAFEIQIINFDRDFNAGAGISNNEMKKAYGFLPNIKTALELENRLIGDVSITNPALGGNPFKIWLKAKIDRAKTEKILTDSQIRKTKFLKKL